jgi:5-methylcytosine-specific restriction endonuclease McrA
MMVARRSVVDHGTVATAESRDVGPIPTAPPTSSRNRRIAYLSKRRRAARRSEFLKDKSCVRCGSQASLEVDHIDPLSKEVEIRRLWDYRTARREVELAKCQVLCKPCHKAKSELDCQTRWKLSLAQADPDNFKTYSKAKKLSVAEVRAIKRDLATIGRKHKLIARKYGVSRHTVAKIAYGLIWRDV